MQTAVDDLSDGPKFPVGQHERLFHGFLEAGPDAVVIIDGRRNIGSSRPRDRRLIERQPVAASPRLILAFGVETNFLSRGTRYATQ